ncbi:zinc-dependent alcohol dehydrogenase family protein [Sodalis sp. RH22]|uniref:zinc-dependent alcohol dehydrogenase family protein n=1 Tax=unclassified Sodalis (in: enterobacteria) TaxID=2636512 RepID=UPI0039B59C2F
MKAAQRGQTAGIDSLSIIDIPDPGKPGKGEIRVRIHNVSLNFHDYNVVAGILPAAPGRVLMSDGAGVVESTGEGVSAFKPGDSVISTFFPDWENGECPVSGFSRTPGDGLDGYATTFVVRPAHYFTLAPEGWSHAEASTLPTAAVTAWRALVVEGRIKPGEDVLILGSGGVSVFALQIAKMAGARVWATSSSPDKMIWLRDQGAAGVVNYQQEPEWGERIFEMTGGRGVDHVVEIGGPGTLAQSIKASRIGGKITLIGVFTGIAGDVPTGAIMGKQLTVKGITVGCRTHQQDMIRALEKTDVRPMIDSVWPLDKIVDAFQYQLKGKHTGKIVVEI